MDGVYFFHRNKHAKAGTWDKGIEVKESGTAQENLEAAKQAYHAYLGAYAYNHDANTDYVGCFITDLGGNRLMWEVWDGTIVPNIGE